ncbi:MAG: hypothetical protein ACM3NF_07420 [Gemmatimonadota bacterium]
MRRYLVPSLVLASSFLLPRTAAPWGNAPTHFGIGFDLAYNVQYDDVLPAGDNRQLFVRANACPDLAWTPSFGRARLGYVHSPEFAEALVYVANSYPWKSSWGTIARAYGAHIAADDNVHATFFDNVGDTVHSLVEVSVDTIIYYDGTPLDPFAAPPAWDRINVGYDACDPYFFVLASRRYRQTTGQAVPAIQWWNMLVAVPELESSIAAEYAYIKLKGDTNLSEAYLGSLVKQGLLPGPFQPFYLDSLDAAAEWIGAHH